MPHSEQAGTAKTDSDSWDRFWSKTSPGTKPSWSKKRICKILQRYAKPDITALDAGCGSGFFSAWFLSKDCIVSSLDYSETALEAARKFTGGRCANYINEDLVSPKKAALPKNSFDMIFSDGLFEHFEKDRQDAIFANMKVMLKSGGVIVAFVPNLWTPWTLLRPFLMPGIYEKPFTLHALKELYARNGCEVIESGGINVLPISLSPDSLFGARFGMLVYAVGKAV